MLIKYDNSPGRCLVAKMLPMLIFAVGLICISRLALAQPPADPPLDFGQAMVPAGVTSRPINRTSSRTVQLLGEALATEQAPSVRVRLVRDLGVCMRAEAEPYLRQALRDSESVVRAEAAQSIGDLEDPALVSLLEPALSDSDPWVRREAVLAAGKLGDKPAVTAGLNDSSSLVISAAIESLSSKPEIIAAAAKLETWPVSLRVLALNRIGQLGMVPLLGGLDKGLSGSVPEKCAALRALSTPSKSNDRRYALLYASSVIKLLHDPHPTVRRCAVEALANVASVDQQRALAIAMLRDADMAVRAAAARLLASCEPPPQAIALLVQQLNQPYAPLHHAVLDALVAAGPAAQSAAASFLDDPDSTRRADGSYILGRQRCRLALSRHINLLGDSDWHVVEQAAQSLGHIGAKQAEPALAALIKRIPYLSNEVPQGQLLPAYGAAAQAIIAAAKLDDSPTLPSIEAHIGQPDYPPTLREAYVYAYGRLANGAHSSDAAERMLSIYEDKEEGSDLKFEALKALGNLRCVQAASRLKQIAATESDPKLRWIAHWSLDRITRSGTPFVPPTVSFRAEDTVSIASVQGSSDDLPSFSAVLQLSPYYAAGRWMPVRLELQNPNSFQLDGRVMLHPSGTTGSEPDIELPIRVPAYSHVTAVAYACFSQPVSPKESAGAPIATAEWLNSSGKRLARGSILGQSTSTIKSGLQLSSGAQDSLLLSIGQPPEHAKTNGFDPYDANAFAKLLSRVAGFNIQAAELFHATFAPDHRAGYDGVRYVHIPSNELDSLNLAQRAALLEQVRAGGRLLVTVPEAPGSDPMQTWLAPWFPVQVIGHRQMAQMQSNDGAPFSFPHAVPLAEAVERASRSARDKCQVIVQGQHLIYAAIRHLGLGRIIFVSFPINSLDPNEKYTTQVWQKLMGFDDRISVDWRTTALAEQRDSIMESMIGFRAAPFTLACVIVGAYLLLALLAHAAVSSVRRPLVYALMTAGALVLAFALAVCGEFRRAHQQPMAARLVTLDLGRSGGGLQQELIAYMGKDDPDLALRTTHSQALLRLAQTDRSDTPPVRILPFSAPRAEMYAAAVKTMWQVNDVIGPDHGATAEALFGPKGLTLTINNKLAGPVRDPLLIWDEAGDPHVLPELRPGHDMGIQPIAHNDRGDFSPATAVLSQQDRLHARILTAAIEPSPTVSNPTLNSRPYIAGWLDDAIVPHLIDTNWPGSIPTRTEALLRFPVRLEPSAVGSEVRVDGAFNHILLSSISGNIPPFDPVKCQWIASTRTGQWLIGFRPPPRIGKLRPRHVRLDATITAPGERITMLRQQCPGGRAAQVNVKGAVVAHWDRSISSHSVEFDCQAGDFDNDGCVWLLLQVDPIAVAGTGEGFDRAALAPWRINRLELTYQARVIAATSAASTEPISP